MQNPDDVLEIRVDITPALAQKLTRVGVLLGKRYHRRCTLPEAMDGMAEFFLERLDPDRRAHRLAARAARRPVTERPAPLPKPPVPSQIKLGALRRDRNQCHFPKGDGLCGIRKRVDVFPCRRLTDPRKATLKDVVTLCSRHWKESQPQIKRGLG
jgi:hypothetical protein